MTHGAAHALGTIGVAGCGAMGRPMAERLLRAGFEVLGFDVRPPADFGGFARHMSFSAPEFARRCARVISVVRDAEQTRALCFEQQALFAAADHPRTLVLSSTLAPEVVHAVGARLPPGVELVDAPMSGAPHSARSGELTFMLGGDEAVLDRLQPLFASMGRRLFRLGPTGAGMSVKVLNNYVAAASVVSTRRALHLARRLGVDPAQLRAVMQVSSGANWYADHFEAIDWAGEGYAAGSTIAILEKDVEAALAGSPGGPEPLDLALLAALRGLEPL